MYRIRTNVRIRSPHKPELVLTASPGALRHFGNVGSVVATRSGRANQGVFFVKFKQVALRSAMAAAFAVIGVSSYAVEGTASASGTVIAPIAITKGADLNFGKFARGAGGSITVATNGTPSSTGIVRSTTVTPTAARFDVTGDAAATYSITYTGTSTTLSDGATNTMTMAIFSDLTGGGATSGSAATGLLNGSGTQSVYVGGTLTVGATQVAGTYTGSVKVQVEYN